MGFTLAVLLGIASGAIDLSGQKKSRTRAKRRDRDLQALEQKFLATLSGDPLQRQVIDIPLGQAQTSAFNYDLMSELGTFQIEEVAERQNRESTQNMAQLGLTGWGQNPQQQFQQDLIQRARDTQIQTMNRLLQEQQITNAPAERFANISQSGKAILGREESLEAGGGGLPPQPFTPNPITPVATTPGVDEPIRIPEVTLF